MKYRKAIIFITTILLTAALVQISATAQETSAQKAASNQVKQDAVENPLRPADTTSPRDTLRSFLTDFTFMIEEWQRLGTFLNTVGVPAYDRAISTFDFSTTPNSDSRMIINTRLALLYEILARIELPPESEIPGDAEVVNGAINQWTIPGSQITIRRIEQGPRTGEFLFSAWSVQRFPRFYRMVKHLPYRPGVSPGVFEALQRSEDTILHLEQTFRNRLRPVDTSSPRATLEGFLDSVNRAYILVMETHAALKASPPEMTIDEARKFEAMAENLMRRAAATLDLSDVPRATRPDVGIESALQLKEILDRAMLPLIDTVPDLPMVKAERQRLGSGLPVRWRYPNTPIEIIEVLEGEQQGSFLFSAATIRRLHRYYTEVADLPYRSDQSKKELGYISPQISAGFYEFYITTPGDLIPRTTFLGRLVERLPDRLKTVHGGQTTWQWIAMILSVLVLTVASILVYYVFRRLAGKLQAPLNQWFMIFAPLIIAGLVVIAVDYINNDLNITGRSLLVIITASNAIVSILLAWVVYVLIRAIADSITALLKLPVESVKMSLIQLSSRVIGALLFAWVLIAGLRNLGVDVVPLVAGLGVGGLAIALAARPTMESIISSFMIYLDKPFRVGQRVNALGQDGTIEAIGLRSTKIRLLTGPLTSIPNEKMIAAEVQNIGRRPYIRRLFNVTITYDTSPEKINRAVEILREILSVPETEPTATTGATENSSETTPHPNEAINQEDFPPRVYFNELNADSLNIIVIYWYHPPEYWPYLEHANWINIQIMERFNAEGIDFAFPTQTLHLAGDDKRPLTVGQRWESEEDSFSPSAVLAQAAALGAQAVQTTPTAASDAVRPEAIERDTSKTQPDGELTDAPLEDDVMQGDEAGDAKG